MALFINTKKKHDVHLLHWSEPNVLYSRFTPSRIWSKLLDSFTNYAYRVMGIIVHILSANKNTKFHANSLRPN